MNAMTPLPADARPVLLVEDDDGLRGALAACLRVAGFPVRAAGDERAAMRCFKQERPAAVISDLILPQGEGLNTLQAMRKAAPDLPIIVMSGGGMFAATDLLGLASSMGASAALSKPFNPSALIDVVRTLVPRGAA